MIIDAAIETAIGGVQNAFDDNLLGGCGLGSDWTQFFGDYVESRYETVARGMNLIQAQLESGVFQVDCGTCDMDGVYAYVYPSDPEFTIYVCDVFWQVSPNLQIDSQPGTVKISPLIF